ncbi:MAG TPA: hypothetical protein PLM53_16220 [Spirochaetota bacterium]|nr:hypothetical protein [Spirochaetota bacterium]HPC41363.1 hypothetical protein [Spirochaetota bacterium]HPL15458.1 hypothetical protein [Spirochaetota bacterium]HQF10048.1 hypothetical protein [Spirochaetota bacterium]HQH98643.1 hypothetical protein [Spirochaetota bacterium]
MKIVKYSRAKEKPAEYGIIVGVVIKPTLKAESIGDVHDLTGAGKMPGTGRALKATVTGPSTAPATASDWATMNGRGSAAAARNYWRITFSSA